MQFGTSYWYPLWHTLLKFPGHLAFLYSLSSSTAPPPLLVPFCTTLLLLCLRLLLIVVLALE